MKIICTGNPSVKKNIAYAVQTIFPDAFFVHRSNGYDLSTATGIEKFKNTVKNYNVFINSSYIGPGIQKQLLHVSRDVWKSGYVFNIGSTVEYQTFDSTQKKYLESKIDLKSKSLELCRFDFKTTYIIISNFKDNNMLPVAKIIKWILDNKEIQIPIIGINDISLSKEFLKLWNEK